MGGCHVFPKLHLDSVQPEIPSASSSEFPPSPTEASSSFAAKPLSSAPSHPAQQQPVRRIPHSSRYHLAAVPIHVHVVAIIPNVRSPTLEDHLSPLQKCRDKGRRPPVKVLSRRLPPHHRTNNIGTSSSTLLQHLKVSYHPPRSQHPEPARSMVQPDLSLCKHHATSGPRTQQTPR